MLAVAIRAASFIAILQAGGIALFIALFRADLRDSLPRMSSLAIGSAVAALILILLSQAIAAANMAGDFNGMTDMSLEKLSWGSSNGAAAIVRILGALLILASAWRGISIAAWFGIVAIAVSFALTGHTATHTPRDLLAALIVVHIVIVMFWFGALPALLYVIRYESSKHSIARFSALATSLVPILAAVGLLLASKLLPNFGALFMPYGTMLLVKIGGFFALMFLAALNKFHLAPAIERGDASALQLFRRSVTIEYALIVVVLCVTATMTTLFSPD